MRNKPKKVRRVVLGVGHPWFSAEKCGGGYSYNGVRLTEKPVAASILMRGGEKLVDFKFSDVGNWNKVRLVLEVIK